MKRQSTEWEKIFANNINSSYDSTLKKEKKKVKKWAEELNSHFSKEEMLRPTRHMKRCSTSLIIREMQIKTTVRYHSCQNDHPRKEQTNTEKCWQESLQVFLTKDTVGGDANWCSHCGRQPIV